ncbi:Dipeptidase gliJ [Exophiala dermatitidis]
MSDQTHFLRRARQLLRESPLVDGHNDFPYMIRGFYGNNLDDARLQDTPIGQTDLERLHRSQLGGQFWSAYVPCFALTESEKHSRQPNEMDLRAVYDTLQQIDLIHNLMSKYAHVFALAWNSSDILRIFQSGRLASFIGVEGLHQIGNSASVLRSFHRLGVRYLTLAHNKNNRYADSANDSYQLHGGLSCDGRKLIREMNRVGMIIDLSHTTEAVQLQVLDLSTSPVIFSHSSCYTLCPHPRNVTDQVLAKLKDNGGIIMICFLPELSKSAPDVASSLQSVADHIIYAVSKVGYEHVGIGSDFDGMLEGPEGLDDVACYPALIAELLRRNMREEHVKAVMGLNVIRVMAGVEAIARRETEQGVPALNDQIPSIWTAEQKQMLIKQGQRRGLLASSDL